MKNIIILLLFCQTQLIAQCLIDNHSTNPNDSWQSCQATTNPNPARADGHWMMLDLGHVYQLTATKFWNFNVAAETGKGFKDTYLDISLDGNTWTEAADFQIPEATGAPTYTGFDGPDLGGINARYVMITAQNTWDAGSCAGLSDVRIEVMMAVLPIELVDFQATPRTGFIQLDWASQREINFDNYELERSIDGKNFDFLTQIRSEGGDDFQQYQFDDFEVKKGQLYYYRLKMNDLDGSFAYSEIKTAALDNELNVNIFPNPTRDALTIDAGEMEIEAMIIQNVNGQVVQQISNIKAVQKVEIQLLPDGVYFLKIIGQNGQMISKEFVKLSN